MMSLTLEQVLNKRYRLVKDMSASMVVEVYAALLGSGLELQQKECLRRDLDAQVLHLTPGEFNVDEQFAGAVQTALELKQRAIDFGMALEIIKHQPDALAQKAGFLVGLLGNTERDLRWEVVKVLASLDPADLAKHAAALMAKLKHPDAHVRTATMTLLARIPQADLGKQFIAIFASFEKLDAHPLTNSASVRKATVKLISNLEPHILAANVSALVALLEICDGDEIVMLLRIMGCLDREALRGTLSRILATTLRHPNWMVHTLSVEILGKFDQAEILKCAALIVAMLADKHQNVREAAWAAWYTTLYWGCSVQTIDGDDGIVRFCGPVEFRGWAHDPSEEEGVWIGIELHEPKGWNDGSVQGKRYFECKGRDNGHFLHAENILLFGQNGLEPSCSPSSSLASSPASIPRTMRNDALSKLVKHAATLIARLKDRDSDVRRAAVE
eukprot:2769334-Prymnesium_polylepis.1